MPAKIPRPLPTPASARPVQPTPPIPRGAPTEPIEVLGRHQNTGQKDHKGAR